MATKDFYEAVRQARLRALADNRIYWVVELDGLFHALPFVPEGSDPLLPVDPREAADWHGMDRKDKDKRES